MTLNYLICIEIDPNEKSTVLREGVLLNFLILVKALFYQ